MRIKAYTKRFKRRKEPRYGSINKGFTEPELQRFFRTIASEKFALLFRYRVFLGLRVDEVCKLHISNIDFDKRELTIKSRKSGHMDSLLLRYTFFSFILLHELGYLTPSSIFIKQDLVSVQNNIKL